MDCGAQIADDAFHQGLHNVVRNVVLVGLTEVGLHNVGENIEAAGNHLAFGNAVGIGGVHQRKSRVELGIISARFDFFLLVGDNGAAVAFAAGARHSDDHPQRQRLHFNYTGTRPKVLPNVSLIPGGEGYCFTAVHYTAAAHGENHICPAFSGQLCPLLYLSIGGIRHDMVKLYNGLACILQDPDHFIVNAGLLDGTAAVGQQYSIGVLGQTGQIFLYTALSKIDFGCVLKNKVIHDLITSPIIR